MSWDAYLVLGDPEGEGSVQVGEWNYTHNCNGMANAVVDRFRPGWSREVALQIDGGTGRSAGRRAHPGEEPTPGSTLVWRTVEEDPEWTASWWRILNTLTSRESLEFLDMIIGTMMETPELFREMNPENGWGDFDSFLGVLREMRARAAEFPSAIWRVHG